MRTICLGGLKCSLMMIDLMGGDEWLLACVVVVSVALHASEIGLFLILISEIILSFTGQCIKYSWTNNIILDYWFTGVGRTMSILHR